MLPAAKFDRRINIEQRSDTQDAIGQPVETWSLVAAVWANIKHLSGAQAIKAGADASSVKASIRIRYMAGIDAGMRIVADGVHYNIGALLPNKSAGYIDLVVEVVA